VTGTKKICAMIRAINILIIVTISIQSLLAQDCNTAGLEKPLVKKFINQQFGNLISPQSNNIIGNFASLDLKDAEASFAGNIVSKKGSILGIKVRGAVTDGLLPVFSNNRLNSNLGLEVQYNFLDFSKKKKIYYDHFDCEKYIARKRKIEHDYELKKIEIGNEQEKILLQIEIEKADKQILTLENKLRTISGLTEDSLNIEILKLRQNRVFLENQLENLPGKTDLLFKLAMQRNSEISKAQSELRIDGFRLGWFSVGYSMTNNVFKLFDGTLAPDRQISKISFASHSIRFQYSFYCKSPALYKSFFISVGTAFSVQDNFADLTKIEITETTEYGVNSGERSVTSKYNAYTGSYYDNLKSFSVFCNIYWFLFDDNKGALHLYPEYISMERIKPEANLGSGFLMAFKDKETTDNIINAELYAYLSDLFNINGTDENLFKRSGYGIRFTFPINFNL
jgi:hypothetical protein